MDSLRTGSDELVYVQTQKVNLTIKGSASHPNFQGVEYKEQKSDFKISCNDKYELKIRGFDYTESNFADDNALFGLYKVCPLFYEQQRYEIIIEGKDNSEISFWHDNINIRDKITPVGRNNKILTGVINFGNEIGSSDLIVRVDGSNYLRLTIKVFPTKIDYESDYEALIDDVTREVYSIIFDFLKKTYSSFQSGNTTKSTPVEFFSIIHKIFDSYIKSADLIIAHPHHILEKSYEVLQSHKIKQVDTRGLHWIEKHPNNARINNNKIQISKALSTKKQVTYNTKENSFTKYILQITAKKLEEFEKSYKNLKNINDKKDEDVTRQINEQINEMIRSINRRINSSFLAYVDSYESSAEISLVFSMAPGYRDLFKYYLMLMRGLAISGDLFNISIKDLSVLYEYWCFIKLNSMMKDRYDLVSQDVVKTQGNGLFISLVKGSNSTIKYRNPENGELITLSYNPKEANLPTGTQRPDNVLSLQKKGTNVEYEYVFDAKYRINNALKGTDYYNYISTTPGPEIDDINTMHRYRDAIVYKNGASPYERSMFGAYVLFPYKNADEYINHKFYQSINQVNIGGLPFLPSQTKLVSNILEELITESPTSAFERATLPRGTEEKLKKVDWSIRDVLIGDLSKTEQLQLCLDNKCYHIPVSQIKKEDLPIRYIALYQSKRLFGSESGIRYYGEVINCSIVKRSEIKYIPKYSNELYFYFELKEWKALSKPISIKEYGMGRKLTNTFLLEHSSEAPELEIRSEEEYRLFSELKRSLNSIEINDKGADIGFIFGDSKVIFENGKIHVYRNKKIVYEEDILDFSHYPTTIFKKIKAAII